MIRPFTPTDADTVAHVWRTASALAHPFLSSAFLDEEEIKVRDVYPRFAETWVCEHNAELVGFYALLDTPDDAHFKTELGALFLLPSHHGQGLGRAMVDEAVAQRGDLAVQVFERNRIGRGFYDGYGFKPTGTSVHPPTGERVIHMGYTRAPV